MTGDFRTVFTRIRVRGSEDAYQNFVDDLCAILNMPVVDGVGLGVREVFGKNTGKNLKYLRT